METKTAQHTPGPWHVSEGGESVCASNNGRGGPDSRQVAMVSDPNDPMHANPIAKANAKIIAAAPEMLETLNNAARQLSLIPDLDMAIGGSEQCQQWAREARAATDKAEGR